jgi:hypothetical protein
MNRGNITHHEVQKTNEINVQYKLTYISHIAFQHHFQQTVYIILH